MTSPRRKWGNTKPPSGWRPDPRAAGNLMLSGAWLLNEEGGRTAFNFVNDATATCGATATVVDYQVAGVATAKDGSAIGGPARKYTGATTSVITLPVSPLINTTFSVATWVTFNDATNFQALFSCYTSDSDSVEFFVSGSDTWLKLGQFTSPNGFVDTPVGTVAVGRSRFVCLTSLAGTLAGYIDGVLVGTSTALGLATPTAATYIGARQLNTFNFNGVISQTLVAWRPWTPDEVSALYADPFLWMQPPRRQVWNAPAAAGTDPVAHFLSYPQSVRDAASY